MTWTPYGPRAALFHFSSPPEERARLSDVISALEQQPPDFILEHVPGLSTLLFIFKSAPGFSLAEQADAIAAWMKNVSSSPPSKTELHEIPVRYDGPDLSAVAAAHGLREGEVVSLHSGTIYHVHMLGFSPGFPYLGPLDARLHTPRMAVPRGRIAAGSVAIGGPHTGIYTTETAGGWHILGTTRVKIFDPSRAAEEGERAMFLLKPGDRVRFVPVHD